MKKAKVLLTILAVVAVISGALAFKAKERFLFYTYDIALPTPTTCNIPVLLYYTTTNVIADGFPIEYTTAPTTYNPASETPCGTVLVKESN